MRKLRYCAIAIFVVCMAWQTAFAQDKSAMDWFHKGVALDSQHVYDEAIKMYTSAIASDRTYVDAYLQRGHAYRVSRPTNPWLAMADFRKVIEIDSTNAEAYCHS
jgi:tetratricopeptide (TPR) repeat protein